MMSARSATGIAIVDRMQTDSWLALLRWAGLGWSFMLAVALLVADVAPGAGLAFMTLLLTPFYYLARRDLDGVGLLGALSFFLVIYSPSFSFFQQGDYRHVSTIAFMLPWLALVERLIGGRAGLDRVRIAAGSGGDLAWCLGWLATSTTIVIARPEWSLIFFVGYALSLFHFARLAGGGRARWIALLGYAAAVVLYVAFVWNFFGRLLIGGLMAMPILLMVAASAWRIRPWMLVLILPPAVGIAQWVRGDDISGDGLLSGSIATPSIVSVQLFANSHLVAPRFGVFFDQFQLFFLAWIPRSFWPEKPLGLGFTLVDDLFGRRGASLEHSIAPGILGEALWSFGPYFLLGLVVTALAFALLTGLQRLLLKESAAIAAVQLCLLPTLVWGGMASFSARYWALAIPLIGYSLFWRLVSARGGVR